MKKRDATSKKAKNLRMRRVFLCLLPVMLAGITWKFRQLQKPIEIKLASGESKRSQELFTRMGKESRNHPYAASITIERVTPWPKESGLDLNTSETLIYNRGNQKLDYGYSGGVGGYGWTFGKVRASEVKCLADAKLPSTALYLPPKIKGELLKRGCVLLEESLP